MSGEEIQVRNVFALKCRLVMWSLRSEDNLV